MEAIATQGLERTYRSRWGRSTVHAVRGLDLTVPSGTVFGLLGPNGSGKTTTIMMVLGLLPPTAGHVSVLGRPAGHRATRQQTGFLPEETYLYEFLSGEETLHLVGRLHGMPRKQRVLRVEELLKRTKMWEARKRRLGTYSKGMARRIGLAQALLAEPDLLVLDEPTSGLDPIGNREVKDLLREVASAGVTVLLSSHLLADVADVCDQIAILHRGRKILSGSVNDLLADADRLVWETGEASDEAQEKIRAAIRAEGVELHDVGRPTTSLERLFLDVLARDQESPNQEDADQGDGRGASS